MHFLIHPNSLKNTINRISVFVLALFLVTACTKEPQKQQVTVTFNSQGGSAVEDVPVEEGQPVAEPTPPTKASSIFKGWFTDKATTPANVYDFDDPVNTNLTLYAKWVDASTVMFDSQGGSAVADVPVEEGQPVAEPTPPTKANSIFKGWFTDKTATPANAYDFDDPVNANLTLYAKWANAVTVAFDSQQGSAVADVIVEEGQPVAEPTPPTRAPFAFGGWFKDAATTPENAYDFDDPVNANLTLYAKWVDAFTVKLYTDANTLLDTQQVNKLGDGKYAGGPFSVDGKYIYGYFTDVAKTRAFDFDNALTTDITLYVKAKDRVKPANRAALITEVNSAIKADPDDSPDLNYINTEDITNMDSVFRDKRTFNGDVSTWDVSKVTNMSSMFQTAVQFNQNISTWDVSKVTNMQDMFFNAFAFNQDISRWDVSSVTTMQSMFQAATSFNQNISGWDVSSVTDMSRMFQDASAFNQDLGAWGEHFNLVDGKFTGSKSNMFTRSKVNPPPLWF